MKMRMQMFARRIFIIISILSLGCLLEVAQAQGVFSARKDELILYHRKIPGKRFLDTTQGTEAISENLVGALFIWSDYSVGRPFNFASFSLELHLDATIESATASTKIRVALLRNGAVVYTADVYELPPGQTGQRLIDIQSDITIYPPITFNQGDEIGFYFQQVLNLNPCRFRYNGSGIRDDSHLTVHPVGTDFPIVELEPNGFDVSLDTGASTDTLMAIVNGGNGRLHYQLVLPQGQTTIIHEDEEDGPVLHWVISDQFGQDYYNVRFTTAQACTLKSVRLLLSPEGTTGSPDLVVYVWMDDEGFPGAKLDTVLVENSSLVFSPSWLVVKLPGSGRFFTAHQDFHIGYTAISRSPGDALAIHSDDGLPVGNQRRSSGLWGDNWKTVYDRQGIDANFSIRATVNYGGQPGWLSCGSSSGSIGPMGTHQIPLNMDAIGLGDGIYRSGVIVNNDSPDRSVVLPVILRVGQTSAEDNPRLFLPHQHFLWGNYPNPFNSGTVIRYQVGPGTGECSRVTVDLYNIAGQRLRRLVDVPQTPGLYSLWWDGQDTGGQPVASGVYLCRLEVDDFWQTQKMILLR